MFEDKEVFLNNIRSIINSHPDWISDVLQLCTDNLKYYKESCKRLSDDRLKVGISVLSGYCNSDPKFGHHKGHIGKGLGMLAHVIPAFAKCIKEDALGNYKLCGFQFMEEEAIIRKYFKWFFSLSHDDKYKHLDWVCMIYTDPVTKLPSQDYDDYELVRNWYLQNKWGIKCKHFYLVKRRNIYQFQKDISLLIIKVIQIKE